MAYLGETFDPSEVPEDERSFDPMPAGDYNVQIVESEIAPTKSGGDMLKLTLELLDGPFANRKVWDNLNIRNANPQAQSIAHRALADICAAVGVGAITDSEDLHFKPFVATLKIEPAREVNGQTYDARNAVKKYKSRSGSGAVAPAASKAAAQAAAPRQAAGGASRPWANGSRQQPPEAACSQGRNDPPF